MDHSMLSLAGFLAWTLAMTMIVALTRAFLTVTGAKRANEFSPDDPRNGTPFERRATRAHMNCVENLPIFATIILIHHIMAFQIESFGWMAPAIVGARVCQSSAHMVSTKNLSVMVRFTFFLAQLVLMSAMTVQLLQKMI